MLSKTDLASVNECKATSGQVLSIYLDIDQSKAENLNRTFENYSQAKLLIGMCMDNRKHLHMPDNFSFIIHEYSVGKKKESLPRRICRQPYRRHINEL